MTSFFGIEQVYIKWIVTQIFLELSKFMQNGIEQVYLKLNNYFCFFPASVVEDIVKVLKMRRVSGEHRE